MNKYLQSAIEWAARRILNRAVARAAEILLAAESGYDDSPKTLAAPRLLQIEYKE